MSSEPSPPRRRLEPDERREQILACARRLFGERHYSAVSTTELARAAGVARGLIHHYFGTKRELYLEVVRQMMFVPEVLVEQLPSGTVEERVVAGVGRTLDVIGRNRDMWLAAIGAGEVGRDPEVEQIVGEADEIAADRALATVGLADVDAGRDELKAMIRAYGGMLRAATREWLVRESLTREQTRDLLSTTLLAVVGHVRPDLLGSATPAPGASGHAASGA